MITYKFYSFFILFYYLRLVIYILLLYYSLLEKLQFMNDKKASSEINEYNVQIQRMEELIEQRPLIEAITIDADESKDLDDAFWIEQTNTGWIIDVAIADITFMLEPHRPLFELARKRQTSVYRAAHVQHMFPTELSESTFSLAEGGIKPVVWFTLELDHQLNVFNIEIREARFSSLKRFTYAEVARIITKQETFNPFFNMLNRASVLSLQLLQKRRDKGALAFFDLSNGLMTDENGQILTIKEKQTTIAYILVQEMMILTNTAVASFFAANNIPFVYRNHTMRTATPPRDVFIEQYEIALHDPTTLKLLKNRIGLLANSACYETCLNGHYGLNESAYAHVTSPIRRFADIICHYQIRSYLTDTPSPFSPEELDFMCSELNEGERNRREMKSEHFLTKARDERNKKAKELSFQALIELDKKAFREILTAVKKMGAMRPELEQACLYKLSNNMMNAVEIYYMVLYLHAGHVAPELFEATKQAILNLAGSASQIMQYIKKDKMIDDFYEEEQMAPSGGFLSRIVGVVNGGELLSVKTYALAANKKKASHLAAASWVMAFLSHTLTDAAETKLPDEATDLSEAPVPLIVCSAPFVNHYGKLLEMTKSQENLSVGVDEYTRNVVEHAIRFKCMIPLVSNDKVVCFEGEGTNKKQAKQSAAAMVIDYIEKEKLLTLPEAVLENSEAYRKLILEENFAGLLQLHVHETPNSNIKFTYTERQEEQELYFTCHLHLTLDGQLHQFDFYAKSKVEGRKQTSKMALEKLFTGRG